MINKIEYINSRKQSIVLDHKGPLFLFEPEGFHGLDVDLIKTRSVYQEGATYRGVTLQDRVLTLNCYMLVDNESQREILKRKLYQVFNPKLEGTLNIFKEGVERKASRTRVIQAPVFKDDYKTFNQLVEFQIQIGMPLPYFEDLIDTKVEFGNDLGNFFFDLEIEEEGREFSIRNDSVITNVYNPGDGEPPLRIVFRAKSHVVNPSLHNIYTKEFIKINRTMKPGEEITVTTNIGNKKVVSTLNRKSTNILNDLEPGSSFMKLEVGDNVMKYDAEGLVEQLEVYLYFTNYYLGV